MAAPVIYNTPFSTVAMTDSVAHDVLVPRALPGVRAAVRILWQDSLRAPLRQCGQCLRRRGIRGVILLTAALTVVLLRSIPSADDSPGIQDDPAAAAAVMSATVALTLPLRVLPRASVGGGCRNTVQGAERVADDTGRVCERRHLDGNGCCQANASGVGERHACSGCRAGLDCCTSYEVCVACCSDPVRAPQLAAMLRHTPARFARLFSAAHDQWELCLARCRSSSASVQHENKYRDRVARFCFGSHAADLIATALK